MNNRWLIGGLVALMSLALACKGDPLEAERKAAESAVTEKAGTAGSEKEKAAILDKSGTVGSKKVGETASTEKVAEPDPANAADEEKTEIADENEPVATADDAVSDEDKVKLAECYTEVYCAQKKGQVDRILDLYKKYGFDTPQSFTETWVKAARDTDWVTRIAHDVSKKCQP